MNHSLEMLETVAEGLGGLRDQVVFVGGSTVLLYSENPAAGGVRPTDDVDCVVEVASRYEYHELEADLRRLGFRHDMSGGAPLCRWVFQGVHVDVMPTDPEILGFANRWYDRALSRAQITLLPSGLSIQILRPEYFLATKLEALRMRGGKDIRLSPDLEDIVFLVDTRLSLLSELREAEASVRGFVALEVKGLREHPLWGEALLAALSPGVMPQTRERIDARYQEIAALVDPHKPIP